MELKICDSLREEVYDQLRLDIISGSSVTLSFCDLERKNVLKEIVFGFWSTLRSRLMISGLTHLNPFTVNQNDLAVYDDYLMSYMTKAKSILGVSFFATIRNIYNLKKYKKLMPMPLLTFRKRLLSIRAKQLEKANFLIQFEEVECKISQQLVTFRSVQLRPTIGSFSQKIDNFLRQIAMSPVTCANLRNLISLLNQALKSSELAEFSPILLPFGSLVTGLATFNSDLDLLIKFEALPVDAIDYETSLIALEVIRPIFNDKLGLSTSEKCIYSSGRCPIVALKFDQCIPNCVSSSGNLHFNRCDISFHQLYSYYNSKLLEFLVSYDRRFYEMSMLIKYWAKRAGLIGKETLSTYGLYMMIVFIMQQTSPPILPTIERLQKLAQLQSDYVPIKVDKYNFAFCDNPAIIGRSHCPMTTEELVVKFINYYQSFNYRNQAICPRLGKLIDKNTIYTRNSAENLGDTNSIFKQTFIVIEDPFVTDNNCGGIFHRTPMSIWQEAFDDAASRIRREPNNILEILTNPKVIFNSH